ncbi:39S ribosomal protein L47, mitochondrial-like [Mizuhopecten yessoensis]|uniref:Large ribosomal subunit protein uL29m n=1 Tax=Mizuhopecten yessoensis TaxID=6573 RepID=A0A210PXL9_MIZYE|nr:39S ribosomal protein L47, mitochondrial-like [Mizuhopecten yessoensis]OWF41233.1 39S ribosomal protein L47, mitochondrial [Mizuhopecten yessoensis]
MALQMFRRSVSVIRHSVRALSRLTITPPTQPVALDKFSLLKCGSCRNFHVSVKRPDLMEFFDSKDNWGEENIKTGRPWKMEELRIKSNSDLHKLWYVLLKERNMLLTMRHEYRQECILFPNPERIDKVEESMENLMNIIKERDNAHSLLETGKSVEREKVEALDSFGRPYMKRQTEHALPQRNIAGKRMFLLTRDPWMRKSQRLLREKYLKTRHRERKRELRYIRRTRERFPDATEEDIEHGLERESARQKQGFYDV